MEAKRASKQDILSALSTSVPRKTNLTLNNTSSFYFLFIHFFPHTYFFLTILIFFFFSAKK